MTRVCKICGENFEQHTHMTPAKRCPRCKDLMQKRSSVCVSRRVVIERPAVRITGLPTPWTFVRKHRSQDFSSYKIEVKGRELPGAVSGKGRIVVRSPSPYPVDSLAAVRVMHAKYISRDTGNISNRIYASLSEPKGEDEGDSLCYFTVHEHSIQFIDDLSFWTHWTEGKLPNGDRIMAFVSIVNEDNPFIIDDGNMYAEYP